MSAGRQQMFVPPQVSTRQSFVCLKLFSKVFLSPWSGETCPIIVCERDFWGRHFQTRSWSSVVNHTGVFGAFCCQVISCFHFVDFILIGHIILSTSCLVLMLTCVTLVNHPLCGTSLWFFLHSSLVRPHFCSPVRCFAILDSWYVARFCGLHLYFIKACLLFFHLPAPVSCVYIPSLPNIHNVPSLLLLLSQLVWNVLLPSNPKKKANMRKNLSEQLFTCTTT